MTTTHRILFLHQIDEQIECQIFIISESMNNCFSNFKSILDTQILCLFDIQFVHRFDARIKFDGSWS